jgi:hypothetical protein
MDENRIAAGVPIQGENQHLNIAQGLRIVNLPSNKESGFARNIA